MRNSYPQLGITSYLGAKQKLLDVYLDFMRRVPHDLYIEPFVGMGNICLNFPTRAERIVNDLNINNAILFKALSSSDYSVTSRFLNNLSGASYCEAVYKQAYSFYTESDIANKALEEFEGDFLADTASVLYVLFRLSYCGDISGTFFKPDSYSRVQRFKKHLFDLPDIIRRMQGVRVKNMDAVELIKQYADSENALIFCDPPYVSDDTTAKTKERSKNSSRLYSCGVDYVSFLSELKASKSKIILCNYDNILLREELVANGWNQIPVGVKNIEVGIARGSLFRASSVEFIYTNYQ